MVGCCFLSSKRTCTNSIAIQALKPGVRRSWFRYVGQGREGYTGTVHISLVMCANEGSFSPSPLHWRPRFKEVSPVLRNSLGDAVELTYLILPPPFTRTRVPAAINPPCNGGKTITTTLSIHHSHDTPDFAVVLRKNRLYRPEQTAPRGGSDS